MSNRCPICGQKTRVIDTERTERGTRRRRKCPVNHRHSTLEIHVDDYKQLRILADKEEIQRMVLRIVQIHSMSELLLKELGVK